MDSPRLIIRNLHKRFGDLVALSNVNLDVAAAEFVCLVGPSGCGKTTLLRIIDGLEAADHGECLLNGTPISGPGPNRGFVFQADSLLPWRNIWKNVVLGQEVIGRRTAADDERCRSLIDLVGLKGFDKYYPWQLSGGMRQRANLARALAINPDVLLMDEPFSALDAQTREIMQTELMRIWEAGRKTVLFVTHQIDEAVYLSDRVVVLGRRPGRIKEIVDIELERPRPLHMKRSAEFTAYVDKIWSLIEQEVRESLSEERPGESGAPLAESVE
jgi:NitT/TauT family transport system ATP-binding protein